MSAPANDFTSVSGLLQEAGRKGIVFFLDKGTLKYRTSHKDKIDPQFIEQLKKFRPAIEDLLREQATDVGPAHSHLHRLSEDRGNAVLFMLPGTPGYGEACRDLATAMEDSYSVYGVDMMGLKEGEEPLSSLMDTAALIKKWIRQMQPAGPYRFIGHSLGAYLAFEITRQLEAEGQPVEFLVLVDASLPLNPPSGSKAGSSIDHRLMHTVCFFLQRYNLITLPYPDWIRRLHTVTAAWNTEDKPGFLLNYIRERVPLGENATLMLRTLYVMMIHALMHYTPAGGVQAKVLIVRAEAANWSGYDAFLGWKEHADQITAVSAPGDHFSIMNQGNAIGLMKIINENLYGIS